MRTAIVVIAKEPLAGRVKTRLCPPLTHDQAATLARASLTDTLTAVAQLNGRCRHVLALDGTPGDWLPAGFDVIAQRGNGLAERLAAAVEDVAGPALVIGMDTPQVTPQLLTAALDLLDRHDAVLGDAPDGGYWAIGLRDPDPRAFDGVPMSVEHTGARQRARLHELGLDVSDLPPLRDVDDLEDARAVAHLAPRTRFAEALACMTPTPAH